MGNKRDRKEKKALHFAKIGLIQREASLLHESQGPLNITIIIYRYQFISSEKENFMLF